MQQVRDDRRHHRKPCRLIVADPTPEAGQREFFSHDDRAARNKRPHQRHAEAVDVEEWQNHQCAVIWRQCMGQRDRPATGQKAGLIMHDAFRATRCAGCVHQKGVV